MYRFFVKLTFLISAIVISQGLRCSLPTESCLNGGRCEASLDGNGECNLKNQFCSATRGAGNFRVHPVAKDPILHIFF
ncbi:hypothetical protein UPYG_G00287570 [Umbra pygmaea]|uniref:Uncharacterized protein n=1 Tax=Umbra pygmaea TaxID=75934 RepID=A0ABD0W494_UMBPY